MVLPPTCVTVNLLSAVLQVVAAPSRWQRRWTIVALCFLAFMLCNMDRVNMSIAILPVRILRLCFHRSSFLDLHAH